MSATVEVLAQPSHADSMALEVASSSRTVEAPAQPRQEDFLRFRSAMDEVVRQAVRNLYSSVWDTSEYDLQLRGAVSVILDSVGATALLVSQRHQRVNLYCPASPGNFRNEKADHVSLRKSSENLVRRCADVAFARDGHGSAPGVRDPLRRLMRIGQAHGVGFRR